MRHTFQHTEDPFKVMTDLKLDETQKENRTNKMDLLKRFSSLSNFSFCGSTGLSNSLLAESGTKPGWAAGHHRPESNFLSAFLGTLTPSSEDSRDTL